MPDASIAEPETEEPVDAGALDTGGEELQLEPPGASDDTAGQPEVASEQPAAPEAPEEPELSFREIMAQRGLSDLARMPSDEAAFEAFVERARTAEQNAEMARWGQYHLQHEQQFRAWQQQAAQYQQMLAQQQAAQRQMAQQQAQESAWKPPEFHPGWLNMVERVIDPATGQPTGELRSKPGADPLLPSKIQAYADWKESQETKFWSDPYKFVLEGVSPHIEQVIAQRTQAAIQQAFAAQQAHFAAQQQAQQAQSLVQGNLNWLVEHDPEGRPLRSPTGGYVPTPEGRRMGELVQQAQQMGIPTDAAQWAYATNALKAEIAQQWMAEQSSGAQNAAATQPAGAANGRQTAEQVQADKNVQFLRNNKRQASRNGNRTGSIPKPGQNAPVQNSKLDFREMLRQNAEAAGLTDEDVNENFIKHFVA